MGGGKETENNTSEDITTDEKAKEDGNDIWFTVSGGLVFKNFTVEKFIELFSFSEGSAYKTENLVHTFNVNVDKISEEGKDVYHYENFTWAISMKLENGTHFESKLEEVKQGETSWNNGELDFDESHFVCPASNTK